MYENSMSKKTKKDNMVKTRVQGFQHNYQEQLQRVRASSSMNTLAGSMYNPRQNEMISPRKDVRRMSSSSMLARVENPEGLRTLATKGMNSRASHISNYSDINTALILERRRLEDYSTQLKQQIARENRLLNNANTNCKKLNNQLDKATNTTRNLMVHSGRLNDNTSETRQDRASNRNNRDDRRRDNQEKNAYIAGENQNVEELNLRCRLLKNEHLVEDKNRTVVKGQLIKRQKVMASACIRMEELEQERANLLLEINQSVIRYKLE